jgi:hypothetical protein
MRLGERNAGLRRMLAQRPGPVVVELDVVGGNCNAGLAKVFGKDAADFAIADEADLPAPGITSHCSKAPPFCGGA